MNKSNKYKNSKNKQKERNLKNKCLVQDEKYESTNREIIENYDDKEIEEFEKSEDEDYEEREEEMMEKKDFNIKLFMLVNNKIYYFRIMVNAIRKCVLVLDYKNLDY
jgi:hypothetical protein